MNIYFVNSKTAVVKVPSKGFLGEITEIERLAERIGQYGNILSYRIDKQGDHTNVIFKLDKKIAVFKQLTQEEDEGFSDNYVDYCDLGIATRNPKTGKPTRILAFITVMLFRNPDGKLSASKWGFNESSYDGISNYLKALFYAGEEAIAEKISFPEFVKSGIQKLYDSGLLDTEEELSLITSKPGTMQVHFSTSDVYDDAPEKENKEYADFHELITKTALQSQDLTTTSTVVDTQSGKKYNVADNNLTTGADGKQYIKIKDESGNDAVIENTEALQKDLTTTM